MTHPETDHAVAWWTSQLRTIVTHDAGDREVSARFNALAARTPQASETEMAKFAKVLADIINEQIQRRADRQRWDYRYANSQTPLRLETWHAPLDTLAEAVDQTAVNPIHLPMKTVMRITPGLVTVHSGAHGVREDVWHA